MNRFSNVGNGVVARGGSVVARGDGEVARDNPSAGAGAATDLLTLDIHQHLWPEPLIAALRRREAPPRLRGWTLELAGEPDYAVDPRDHDRAVRAAEVAADGIDLALISLSSALGIELLAPSESRELLEAYHAGALELPRPFGAWASACLTEVDGAALERELERGFVGLQLPANALLDGGGYEHARPLLKVLEDAGKPLLVHPGPAGLGASPAHAGSWVGAGRAVPGEGAAPGLGAQSATGETGRDAPSWWPAMVTYVQQMHAAWFAFRAYGRDRHPRLRVCFAMLAGMAPLHGERFASRAGGRTVVDDGVFLDVSSYGTRAVDATVRVMGIDALVNGSDRPYAKPVPLELGAAAQHALHSSNPIRLLDLKEVFNGVAVASNA